MLTSVLCPLRARVGRVRAATGGMAGSSVVRRERRGSDAARAPVFSGYRHAGRHIWDSVWLLVKLHGALEEDLLGKVSGVGWGEGGDRDARRSEREEDEVVTMTSSPESESTSDWPPMSDHVSAEELAHRQGVRPIASVDELAQPGTVESDEELDEFLADLSTSRRAGQA